jgi:hypothetical protein
MPKIMRTAGVPKEAVPLAMLMRQKKKNGEDVSKLVDACLVAIGH